MRSPIPDRGGVRELSYDPVNARSRGQTESEIRAEAILQDRADRSHKVIKCGGLRFVPHAAYPARFYLLRFLGLSHAAQPGEYR